MIKTTDYTLPSCDGVHQLHIRTWSGRENPVGIVQLVHGVAEHIGRYDEYAGFLASAGFLVAGDDHLGHGQSVQDSSEYGWFADKDGWDLIVRDEKALYEHLKAEYPGLPAVLFGHSMGSFMARTTLGKYPTDYNACILSGTGWQSSAVTSLGLMLAEREIKKHGSKYHSKTLQKLAFGSYLKGIDNPLGENDWICRDPAIIRAYDADPLCGFPSSAGLMRDMMTGLKTICDREYIAKTRPDLPILFISGEADPVGGWGKSVTTCYEAFRSAGIRDVTMNLYPGDRHEVLNELDCTTVWADTLSWMRERLGLQA